MADRLRLLSRLAARAEDGRPIAWRGREPIRDRAFRARVAGWRSTFAGDQGRAVALFHSDGVEFAAALFGAWHAGCIVYLPGDDLPATCRHLASVVHRFAGEFPADCAPVPAPADGDADTRFADLAAEFDALVLHTAGSTGEPKAIPKRLAQLALEVETLDRVFGAELGDAEMVATVSHQHIYGLLYKILWPLATGRSFLARTVVYPEELAAVLADRRTALISSPAHLGRLPDDLDWTGARAGLRAIFSTGSPLPAAAVVRCERQLHVTPTEVYGSSETGGIAWRRCTGGADAAWVPFPGMMLRENDGRLSLRSPYLRDDEWYATDDNASFTADGGFSLTGRADRIVKVQGKRVSLAALEHALVASTWASEARVFALNDGSDRLAAVLVPSERGRAALEREGRNAFATRLRTRLSDVAEGVALPRRWRFVDALPVNSQGKTTTAELARLFDVSAPEFPNVTPITLEADRTILTLEIPPHLAHFDGHFAGTPILPGVVQVDWAIHYGRQHLGFSGEFLRLEGIKFHRVIAPGSSLRLELEWRSANATLTFSYSSAAGRHSSGRILFTG